DRCTAPHATTSSTLPHCSQYSTEKSNHSFSRYLNSVGEENNATQVSKNSDDVEQKLKKPCELYAPVTLYVHPDLDLCKEIHEKAPHLLPECKDVSSLKLFLSGLHTCGSLAVTTLKLFLQDPYATNLCNVGCCYQLMEEQGLDPSVERGENHAVSKEEIHFPLSNCGKKLKLHLGRNARNLASQSLPRLQASGKLQGGDFLWRALLDILLKELNIPVPEKIIGMRGLSKRCKTFQDYVAAAFEKLGISELMVRFTECS
ncbi:methyltransferase-like protein 25, partial [Plakobranchus ocellatus]